MSEDLLPMARSALTAHDTCGKFYGEHNHIAIIVINFSIFNRMSKRSSLLYS